MDLDIDTVKHLERMAVDANRDKIHAAPQEPEGVYYLQQRDGRLERVVAEQKPRNHQLFTFDAFCEAVDFWQTGDHLAVVVFAGRGKVVALLNESDDRKELLMLTLELASEFTTLVELAHRRDQLDQRGFLRMLNIELAGCVDEMIIESFAALKFTKGSEGASNIKQGKESMGRAVTMEVVAGGAAVPSRMTVTLAVYRDLVDDAVRQTVACAVDLNIEEALFCLIPLAGEIERAQRETDLWIVEEVKKRLEGRVNVFCGEPGRA